MRWYGAGVSCVYDGLEGCFDGGEYIVIVEGVFGIEVSARECDDPTSDGSFLEAGKVYV